MKRLLTLCFCSVVVLSMLLTGCSGTGAEEATGEMTFKQAVERQGTHIWFSTAELEGRNTEINAAVILSDGKATVYDPSDIAEKVPNILGTLEDYKDLTEEEAADLIREKYNSGYEEYYRQLEDAMSYLTEMRETYTDWLDAEPEEQERALKETYEELTGSPLPEKEPQEFSVMMKLDDTGNTPASEALKTKAQYDRTYKGFVGDFTSGHTLYSIIDGETIETYFPVDEPLAEKIEVYDSYYGGYSADFGEIYGSGGIHYLITRCDQNAVFMLDEAGAEGIEVTD